MPDYLVTDPATGQRIKMTGPAPPSEALIRLALAKVQPLPSHAPTQLQTPDPLQALQKAQTIGPARVGERYMEPLNPSAVDVVRSYMGGAVRPTSVQAQDPYGIGAWQAGAGPMPTPMMGEIQAFHGSPHDFPAIAEVVFKDGTTHEVPLGTPLPEKLIHAIRTGQATVTEHPLGKFDIRKIGTGEGAQAYGHGLYFAENPAVAEEYKRALGKVVPAFGDEPVKTSAESMAHDILSQLPRQAKDIRQNIYGDKKFYLVDKMSGEWGTHPFETAQEAQAATMTHNTVDAALRAVDQRAQQGVFKGKNEAQAIADVKQAIRDNFGKEAKTAIQGKTYHVSIKADPDQFLDWDKPLSQQSEKIQRIARESAAAKANTLTFEQWARQPAAFRQRMMADVGEEAIQKELGKLDTGQSLYRYIAEAAVNSPEAATALKRRGIPGIKYLDQGSRGAPANWKIDPALIHAAQSFKDAGHSADEALAGLQQAYKKSYPSEIDTAMRQVYGMSPKETHNYVVFDDKLIDILKKYAVAGAVGGSLASLGQQQTEEQK